MNGGEGPVFERIHALRGQMRRSEAKVANYVLAHPQAAISMSISTLAGQCGVSEPTVLRFCRAIGCEGFQDFKLTLAQSIAIGASYIRQGITPEDSLATVATKICDQTIAAVTELKTRMSWTEVERAVDVLAAAPRIEIQGVGASGAVALDAQNKLFRLNVPVTASVDPHMQIMSAASLVAGDVLISFSYSGRAREIITAARMARQRGASVIAVTTADTPVARTASHPICLPVIEDTEHYTPMTSRLLQLVVVDILEIGVALRRGPALYPHLRRLKDALNLVRLDAPTPKEQE
ncbi:transcriptional regulator HexR [Telmatospirillum sp. J64-1]|uniref:transcriptional regulator HexR n=1 Tax=Telmatospirillum sp. J64-1 TaxID=2502183 RepID=UPI00115CD2E7|nr:transcriptional regulator HexR [Telmatospirillum sp. J64-1]